MFMQYGWTALIYASQRGEAGTVRVLVDRGAVVDLRDKVRIIDVILTIVCTMPLSYSVHMSQYEVDVCLMFMQDGHTALMDASEFGNADTVRVLLDRGATVDLRDNVRIIDMIKFFIWTLT